MKITKNSHDKLVLEDRPTLLRAFIALLGASSVIAVLAGQTEGYIETALVFGLGTGALSIAWYFFPIQIIEFNRASGAMTREMRRPGRVQHQSLDIKDIRQAANQGNWSDASRTERIVLLTPDGPVPLELGFTGASRKPQIDAINQWLKG